MQRHKRSSSCRIIISLAFLFKSPQKKAKIRRRSGTFAIHETVISTRRCENVFCQQDAWDCGKMAENTIGRGVDEDWTAAADCHEMSKIQLHPHTKIKIFLSKSTKLHTTPDH
jgi:hypothetical protein